MDCDPSKAAGSIEYWLQCQYVELRKQNGGVVHAVMALGTFAGLRLWKAFKVSVILVVFNSDNCC